MRRDLKTELSKAIPVEKLVYLTRSFDVIGSKGHAVAIIEISTELSKYERQIAEALMHLHGNVKSVLSKSSERQGDFRIRNVKLIGGDPNTEVIHKESSCMFKVDPAKAYFSPRESTERERIAATVKPAEYILVMFSGIGPYAICIAKNHPSARCIAVELNPEAHKYCVENVRINKVADRVTPILGDVREICPRLGVTFDRVLMPLPKGAHEFLDIAIPMVKKEGILHFYHWAPRHDLFSEAERLLIENSRLLDRDVEIIARGKVSAFSPSSWKVRLDARII